MNTTLIQLLDQIEAQLGKIGPGSGKQAIDILLQMDAADERIRSLVDQGSLPKAEIAQFEAIQSILKKEAHTFLKEVGGAEKLRGERAKVHPREDAWWWFIDDLILSRRKASVRGSLVTVGIVAAVLVVLTITYQLFFKPDPRVIAGMEAEQYAQQALQTGDVDLALQHVNDGLAIAGDDPDLLVLKGVLLNLQGKVTEAEVVNSRALSIIGDKELFYIYRCQAHLSSGLFDLATEDAEKAISVNANSARGYLLLGQSYEQKGELQKAYEAYQEASRLGEETQDDATTAQARILMGYLLQAMAIPIPPEETATFTPAP